MTPKRDEPSSYEGAVLVHTPIPGNALSIADLHGCRSTWESTPLLYPWPVTLLVNTLFPIFGVIVDRARLLGKRLHGVIARDQCEASCLHNLRFEKVVPGLPASHATHLGILQLSMIRSERGFAERTFRRGSVCLFPCAGCCRCLGDVR